VIRRRTYDDTIDPVDQAASHAAELKRYDAGLQRRPRWLVEQDRRAAEDERGQRWPS